MSPEKGLKGDVGRMGYEWRLMTTIEAAEVLGVSVKVLQKWRCEGGGPKYVRVSYRVVKYLERDLLDWVESRSMRSTSQESCPRL